MSKEDADWLAHVDDVRKSVRAEASAEIERLQQLCDARQGHLNEGGRIIEGLRERIDELEQALHEIDQWSRAYPLGRFPEPDWEKVKELLRAGGIKLDDISASNMRHVVTGVGEIARKALKNED